MRLHFIAGLSGNFGTAFAIPRRDAVRQISTGQTLSFLLKSLTPAHLVESSARRLLSADELLSAPLVPIV